MRAPRLFRLWLLRIGLALTCVTLQNVVLSTSNRVQAQPIEPAINTSCAITLQSLVDAAPPGGIVTVAPCIYRETVTINKPLTLIGQPGTEIRGSDVWADWKHSGSHWVSGPVPLLPSFHAPNRCVSGTGERCLKPEQVFFDGRAMQYADSEPQTGQFTVDAARNIVLADDPTGHMVEVTVRSRWIVTRQRHNRRFHDAARCK